MIAVDPTLEKAVELAKWLIESKGVECKTAYIIARNKYKLPDYNIIRKAYQTVKRKQLSLL